jgi:hypothetical protein
MRLSEWDSMIINLDQNKPKESSSIFHVDPSQMIEKGKETEIYIKLLQM